MAQRINAISRTSPNAYGNITGTNVPKTGDITKLVPRAPEPIPLTTPPADPAELLKNMPEMPKAKGKSKISPKAMAAGIGIASAAAQMGGQALTKNKNEIAGGALSGAGQGASMGMALGPIGAAVGAVVGAGVGAFAGKRKQDKRTAGEFVADAAKKREKRLMRNLQNQTIGQQEDLTAYQSIVGRAGKTASYESGGLLRYSEVNMDTAREYVARLVKERAIAKHQQGGKVSGEVNQTEKLLSVAYDMFKDGKTPKQIATALKVDEKTFKIIMNKVVQMKNKPKSEDTKLTTTDMGSPTMMFKEGGPVFDFNMKSLRRGGPIDINKQNVIVDGPSHDDLNKTGIKGDKGIPVVHKGIKIAEIESKELVMNAKAMNEIEKLKKKIESGDDDVMEKLGELLVEELGDNTYDYNKEL